MQLINDFMTSLLARWENFIASTKDEEGQTLIEYGLIVALISIVAIIALGTVGTNVTDVFTNVADDLVTS